MAYRKILPFSILALGILTLAAKICWLPRGVHTQAGQVTENWITEAYARKRPGLVVLIHGLGGHPVHTWRSERGNVTLMDLVSRDPRFEQYHVVTLGYPTSVIRNASEVKQRSIDIASEVGSKFESYIRHFSQLVIIGHSQGGVITRLALNKVRQTLKGNPQTSVSIVNLACPFKGSSVPSFAKAFSNAGLTSEQFGALKHGSDLLDYSNQIWAATKVDLEPQLSQFAACEGRGIANVLIVGRESATEGAPGENCLVAEDDDHVSICKPSDLTSTKVGKWLADVILRKSASLQIYAPKFGRPGEANIFRSDLVVGKGERLIVRPGTTMKFENGSSLVVEGSIRCEGSGDAPIIFDFDEHSQKPSGILVKSLEPSAALFQHCRFRHGNGVLVNQDDIRGLSPGQMREHWNRMIELPYVEHRKNEEKSRGAPLSWWELPATSKFSTVNSAPMPRSTGGLFMLSVAETFRLRTRCFTGTTVISGGGGVYTQDSILHLSENRYVENSTGYALFPAGDDRLEVSNPDIKSRSACGGAIYVGFNSAAKMHAEKFVGNRAPNAGGAIYMLSSAQADAANHHLNRETTAHACEFTRNFAGGTGGAIQVDQVMRIQLSQCLFSNNTTSDPRKPGQSIYDDSAPGNEDGLHILNPVSIFSPENEFQVFSRDRILDGSLGQLVRLPAAKLAYSNLTRRVDTVVMHGICARYYGSLTNSHPSQVKQFLKSERLVKIPENPTNYIFDVKYCKSILDSYGVSAHYMIDREGRIYEMVEENAVAYHAGASLMPPPDLRANVNTFSIGIELVGGTPEMLAGLFDESTPMYTAEQFSSAVRLVRDIRRRHPAVKIGNVVRHSDIAGDAAVAAGMRTTTTCKADPGPGFDWRRFKEALQK